MLTCGTHPRLDPHPHRASAARPSGPRRSAWSRPAPPAEPCPFSWWLSAGERGNTFSRVVLCQSGSDPGLCDWFLTPGQCKQKVASKDPADTQLLSVCVWVCVCTTSAKTTLHLHWLRQWVSTSVHLQSVRKNRKWKYEPDCHIKNKYLIFFLIFLHFHFCVWKLQPGFFFSAANVKWTLRALKNIQVQVLYEPWSTDQDRAEHVTNKDRVSKKTKKNPTTGTEWTELQILR